MSNLEKPLVSVLLPSYNHERFVAQSIQSVLDQTWPNIQLIVIDDGSTDASPSIIQELAKVHGFYFEHRKNQGVVKTLNYAKSLVRGKYVALSASDDYFHPEKIEKLVEFLESNPEFAMVHSNLIQVDENSRETLRIRENCPSGRVFEHLLCGRFHINGLTALVRADVYAQYQYGKHYIDDLYMWLSIAKDHPIGHLDDFLAYYRRHDNYLTGRPEKMREAEKEILDLYRDSPVYSVALKNWQQKWFGYYARSTQRQHLGIALHLGTRALLAQPLSLKVWVSWAHWVKNRCLRTRKERLAN